MRCFCLVMVCTFLAVGCGTATVAVPGSSTTPTSLPQSGIRWAIVGIPDIPTLDPALAADPSSISVSSLVYGGLVRLDSRLRVVPDGASSWSISRNGKVYTFRLRPNLRFANGSRVSAHDFVAAMDRALGPEGPAGTAPFYLQLVAGSTGTGKPNGIQALNKRTVRITLTKPAAHFLAELAFPASSVPLPTLSTRYGTSWTDHALGFGPYKVQEWRHSRFLVLTRNPFFYGGAVGPERITIVFSSLSQAIAAYQHGRLDVISGLPAGQSGLPTSSDLRRVPALALDYLAFNTSRLPFHHLSVRRAFASAVRAHMAAASMGSTVFPSSSLIPSPLGSPLAGWATQTSGMTYLKRAGYPGGSHFPSVVLVRSQDPRLAGLARALKLAWLRTLGIDVRIQPLNASNYTRVLNQHAFDLALVRWGGDYPDLQDFLGTQLGASPDNVTGWSKPGYNAAVSLADSYSPVDPRRTQLLRRAAFIATRSLPILVLDEPAVSAIIRPNNSGITITSLGTIALRYATGSTTR